MTESEWLHARTAWLQACVGTLHGPPPEVVTAWMAHDWWEVWHQCKTWQYQVEAAVLVPGQTEEEQRRVVEKWLKPIEAVSGAAMEMTADPDHRRERRKIRAQSLAKQLQHEADWVFTYGPTSFAELPVFDRMVANVADRISYLFVEAASYDIDLSV